MKSFETPFLTYVLAVKQRCMPKRLSAPLVCGFCSKLALARWKKWHFSAGNGPVKRITSSYSIFLQMHRRGKKAVIRFHRAHPRLHSLKKMLALCFKGEILSVVYARMEGSGECCKKITIWVGNFAKNEIFLPHSCMMSRMYQMPSLWCVCLGARRRAPGYSGHKTNSVITQRRGYPHSCHDNETDGPAFSSDVLLMFTAVLVAVGTMRSCRVTNNNNLKVWSCDQSQHVPTTTSSTSERFLNVTNKPFKKRFSQFENHWLI